MTNKINGIDVSECEFYNNYECDAYRHEYWEPQDNTKDMCKWHKDCYFKQLKRLQEENEELKKEVKILREQIFKDNEQYIDLYDDCVSDLKLTRKYKQALEEIREILNKECSIISNAKAVGIINEVLK